MYIRTLRRGTSKNSSLIWHKASNIIFIALTVAPAVVLLNNADYDEEPEPDFNEEADDED